ncbi:MAG: DUF308 domain-containing protein [Muribaculaceae bacterium]|jgi:cytochrome bd-type quinol oxidase subunit 2
MDTEKTTFPDMADNATPTSPQTVTPTETPRAPEAAYASQEETKADKSPRPDLKVEAPSSQAGNIFLSLIMAILGLIFIWMCDRHVVGSTVLTVGGLAFIIPGAALMLSLLVRRKNKSRGSVMTFITAVCGLAAIALGVVILVAPDSFRHLLVYLFGGLLIVSAAWQFDMMMRKNRGILYPAWLTIAPVLIVALGVVMLTLEAFKGEANEKWMMLATGCGFALFGIIGLFISYYAIKATHTAKKLAAAAAKAAKAGASASQVSSQETSPSEKA